MSSAENKVSYEKMMEFSSLNSEDGVMHYQIIGPRGVIGDSNFLNFLVGWSI